MRKLALVVALSLGTVVSYSPSATAQEDAEVKRDPKGVKGISPYNEDLAKGREAFANGDHDGAMTSFEAAIAKDDSKLMGYLLKAQTQLEKGDLAGALQTAEGAKTKQGNEHEQAKLL